MIKDLLLDILDILFPLLLYQFVILTRSTMETVQKQLLLGLLCGAGIVSSMLLPTVITNDFEGDLRSIPLIISLLYGGYIGGFLSLASLLICRWFIAMDGFVLSLVASIAISIGTAFFVARFDKRQPLHRLTICMGLTLAAFFLLWFTSLLSDQAFERTGLSGTVQIGLLHLVTMCMSVYLMEVSIQTHSLQKQMVGTEKLNAISQLSASVAHEIRSPLTAVKGFLQLVLRDVDGKNKEYLEMAADEVSRAEYIINDFLNFAKPQLETIEALSIPEILKQVKESVPSGENVELFVASDENLTIRADRFKIRQALFHIVKNSLDASVSTESSVSITAFRESDTVCISIRDQGVGMTEDEVARLGTPFYSTKTNGTGLGLMVAFKIIHAIGGKVEFTSVKGEGTEARVSLPAAISRNP